MSFSDQEFEYVRQIVRQDSAMVVDVGKKYLAESRLKPLAEHFGYSSISALLGDLQHRSDPALRQGVVEAMAIHETFFFRDLPMYDSLRLCVLPSILRSRAESRTLRIWSAACSSGQEPYSLAMMIREEFPELLRWNLEIIATDFSAEILSRARSGRYTQVEVNRGLPARYLARYFKRDGLHWNLDETIRRMVRFERMNLAENWLPLPPMDLLFLRNVMIYFGAETRREILGKVRAQLRPDGRLFLGSTETTLGIDNEFETCGEGGPCGCFRLLRDRGENYGTAQF